jgi:hypothetical protein
MEDQGQGRPMKTRAPVKNGKGGRWGEKTHGQRDQGGKRKDERGRKRKKDIQSRQSNDKSYWPHYHT